MSEPIVFISHSRVKEGRFEALEALNREVMPAMEVQKPGTVLHYGYADESGREVHYVHVFPDSQAMDAHMRGADERSRRAYELIEPMGFEVYGRPSDETLTALRRSGLDVAVRPVALDGYIRLSRG